MEKLHGTELAQRIEKDLQDRNQYCQKAFIAAKKDGRKDILWNRYYKIAEEDDMTEELSTYKGFLPVTGCKLTFNGVRVALDVVTLEENRIAKGEIINCLNESYNGIMTFTHQQYGRNEIDTVHKTQIEYSTDKYYKYSYSRKYGSIDIEAMANKGGGKKVPLTDEQAMQLYEDYYEKKIPIAELVKHYAVSESTVRRIVKQYR